MAVSDGRDDAGEAMADPLGFLGTDGEVSRLIRAFDWSTTSIGPVAHWPQSLKTVTGMLLLSPVPIVLLWGEDGVMIYNDAYSRFAGRRHPRLLGSKVREGWDEVAEFNDHVMRTGLAGGTLAYRDHQLTLERNGQPEPAWMNLDYSPVLDESGRPGGVIAFVVETTERVLAERALRASEERFRALVNATSDVLYRMSPHWREMRQLDGRGFLLDTNSPSVDWIETYLPPEDQAEVRAAIATAVANKAPFQLEHRVRSADGSIGWTFSRAIPLLDDAGNIVEWFGAASDVTERHRANEHMKLVINELNHRVKNNLAMVQAIALQTFRNAGDMKDAQDRFAQRLIALAHANDLLTGERWTSASLGHVIEQAVRPHCEEEDRCSIEGPPVSLSPKTALAVSLAMHELATNAVKYGAWLKPEGRVEVAWRVRDEAGLHHLHLEWRERGGPPVVEPAQRGFGSRLVERGLAAEMAGMVAMRFEPAGLICVIDAPLPDDR